MSTNLKEPQNTVKSEYPQELKNLEKFHGQSFVIEALKFYIDSYGANDQLKTHLCELNKAIDDFKKNARTNLHSEIKELLNHVRTSYLTTDSKKELFFDLVKGFGATEKETLELWNSIYSDDPKVRAAAEEKVYSLSEKSLETMQSIVALTHSLKNGNTLGQFSNLVRALEQIQNIHKLLKELTEKYSESVPVIVTRELEKVQKEINLSSGKPRNKEDLLTKIESKDNEASEGVVNLLEQIHDLEIVHMLEEDIQKLENEVLYVKEAIAGDKDGSLPLSIKLGSLESEIRIKRKLLDHYSIN